MKRQKNGQTRPKTANKTAKEDPRRPRAAKTITPGSQHGHCQRVLFLLSAFWPKTICFTRFFSPTRAAFATSRDKGARTGHGWGRVGAAHLAGESPLAGDKRGYKYPHGVFGNKRKRKKGRFAGDLTRLRAKGPANCPSTELQALDSKN